MSDDREWERIKRAIRHVLYDLKGPQIEARRIAPTLVRKNIISGNLKQRIEKADTVQDAQQLVADYLHDFGTLETIINFCQVLRDTTDDAPSHKGVAERLEKECGLENTKSKRKRNHEDIQVSSSSTSKPKLNTLSGSIDTNDNVESDTESDDSDGENPINMDDNKLEKENNLDNGGNLVDEDIWDDTRSAVCCIKSVNSTGQPCNSTGFLGFYKGVCRLWTRLHCLTDKKNCKSHALQQNIRERARKAKYWFLYRSRNNSKVEVQGEDLIDDTEIPHYHKKLDLTAVRVHKSAIPAHVIPVKIQEDLTEVAHNWRSYVVTIYGHPKGQPLTRSVGRVLHQEHSGEYVCIVLPSSYKCMSLNTCNMYMHFEFTMV
jgi:hypothetical protein